MTSKRLNKRLRELRTAGDCCQLASDLYGTREDCEGTPAECFIAGWVNAMDMIEEGTLDRGDDEAFVDAALNEVWNMHPETLKEGGAK